MGLYFFSATEADQLFKLPVVFEHYIEHRNGDKSLTFVHFLATHYLYASPRDPDYERDMQLPFKRPCCDCLVFSFGPFLPLTATFAMVPPVPLVVRQFAATPVASLCMPLLSGIWQPPRVG